MKLHDVVVNLNDTLVQTQGRPLNGAEQTILEGAWDGKTYDEIIKGCDYSASYIKQAAGPKLWRLLSDVLGVEINKSNVRSVLERRSRSTSESPASPPSPTVPKPDAPTPHRGRYDLREMPDVSVFYNRTEELTQLEQWTIADGCQLVATLGMAGIGKTLLVAKLVNKIKERHPQEFDCIIWRSLRNAPTVDELLGDLRQCFPNAPQDDRAHSTDDRISQLLDHLRTSRCLLILDNWDAILKQGDFVGQYDEQNKGYGELLKRIGRESHQSCLAIVSRETPREIVLLEEETPLVQSIALQGSQEAAAEILKAKKLSGENRWGILIRLYRANPLALKIVATRIRELFGGDIDEFVNQSLSLVVRDISDLIEQQFDRLSPLERDILYWMAIEQESLEAEIPYLQALAQEPEQVPLIKLQQLLLLVSPSDFLDALTSLRERSLIEKGAATFALQPAVWEYVTHQFVREVCQEITTVTDTKKLKLLRSHALKHSIDRQAGKSSYILTSIQQRLPMEGGFSDEGSMIDRLKEIQAVVQGKSQLEVGYAAENISDLLSEFGVE